MSCRPAIVLLLFLLSLPALAGCGAGGGRSAPDPAPESCIAVRDGGCLEPEAFAAAAAEAGEESRGDTGFQNQWGLAHINADEAYGNLSLLRGADAEPGDGVTIGVLDTGVDLEHPSIAGNANRTVTEVFTAGAVDETAAEGELFSHGTAVASVAAGARTDAALGHHGVAWGADIAAFALTLGQSDGVYRPVAVESLAASDAQDAALFEQIFSWRDGDRKVDILNLSLGYNGLIERYTEQELRDNYGRTLSVLAQADVEEKAILVWAAGNTHGFRCDPALDNCLRGAVNAVSPDILAGLAVRIEELQGHSIAVVALNPTDGRIASFSNRCGLAADFCIAAPGEEIRTAYFGPPVGPYLSRDFVNLRGTSFAAPMVSGGLALMKQIFRGQLSNTELVTRLYETADRSGFYADAAVYGRGSMDLGAATSPVGVLEVPAGAGAARSGLRLPATRLESGPAFGDGFQRSFAGREVMALDRLGAPFWYRLGSLAAASAGVPLAARLRGFLAREPAGPGAAAAGFGEAGREHGTAPSRVRLSRLETRTEVSGSHLALAGGGVKAALAAQGGLSAAAFTTRGVVEEAAAVGASLGWRRPGSPLGVRAGWIGERETLLGSAGQGAFGTFSGDTAFVGVDAHTDLAGWRLGANAELGTVNPAARGGLVRRVSPLATSAFALHAARELGGAGALRFSVSQPLRVERGRASLTVPAARTRQGAVLYEPVRADLAPSGRQMDIAGQWRRPLAEGDLRLGAVVSLRPGHRKAARPEMTFLAGWRVDF